MKALTLSIFLLAAIPAYATTAPGTATVERKQTTTVEHDNGSDNWGWLGLLGLAGLAGLLRKDKRDTVVTNYDATKR